MRVIADTRWQLAAGLRLSSPLKAIHGLQQEISTSLHRLVFCALDVDLGIAILDPEMRTLGWWWRRRAVTAHSHVFTRPIAWWTCRIMLWAT